MSERPSRRAVLLVLSLISLTLLFILRLDLILTASTPNGGDMGAHVLGPAVLRDSLLPSGRLMGWSDAWFAGFPAFYFYFPLPSLTIVALDLLLPYGVAFKLVTVMGVAAIPWAAYALGTSLSRSRITGMVAAAFGAGFVVMESYSIFGGNIPSTLAGEFSFAWSMAFGMWYLATAIRAVEGESGMVWRSAALLAATVLSHIIPTIMFVVVSLPLLGRDGWRRLLPIWGWGFLVSAFWSVPLALRIGLTTDMNWFPLQGWDEVFPVEMWALLPLAAVGMVWAVRRGRRPSVLVVMTLLPLAYYRIFDGGLQSSLPALEPITEAVGKLWNGRILPFWFLGLFLLAALAVGAGVEWLVTRLPDRLPSAWSIPIVGVVAAFVVARLGSSELAANLGTGVAVGTVAALLAVAIAWTLADRLDERVTLGIGIALAYGGAVWALDQTGLVDSLGQVSGVSPLGVERFVGSTSPFVWAIPAAAIALAVLLAVPRSPATNDVLPVAGAAFAFLIGISGVSYSNSWARWNYSGYEAKPVWGEYEALMATVDSLPPGRVHWEANSELDQYGTPMALMLFPYWSEEHPSMEGLYFESSLTTPFHFLNAATMSRSPSNPIPGLTYHTFDFERGLSQLDLYGVSYYVSFTEEATTAAIDHPELSPVAESGPFTIFRLPDSPLVEAVTALPVVYRPDPDSDIASASYEDMAFEWYDDPSSFDRPIAETGPDDWPRIQSLDELPVTYVPQPGGNVSDVVVENGTISFTTDAVGVPHIIKVSYFPNWSTRDADGPYRVTPSLMVVTPTTEHVTLEFTNTWAENIGMALSIVGIGIFPFALRRRRAS